MNTSYLRITDATTEPVTLAQAKAHLRIQSSDTSQDTYITALITAARQRAEKECNRAFISQTWRLGLDYFPWYGDSWKRPTTSVYAVNMGMWAQGMTIYVPTPRLLAVTSLTYIDATGTLQTLSPTTYLVDSDSEPARIMPTPGNYWPYVQLYRPNTVNLTYTCGYGPDATTVPLALCQAILMLISHWYWNRDAVVQGQYNPLPMAVDALLADYKFMTFGYQPNS